MKVIDLALLNIAGFLLIGVGLFNAQGVPVPAAHLIFGRTGEMITICYQGEENNCDKDITDDYRQKLLALVLYYKLGRNSMIQIDKEAIKFGEVREQCEVFNLEGTVEGGYTVTITLPNKRGYVYGASVPYSVVENLHLTKGLPESCSKLWGCRQLCRYNVESVVGNGMVAIYGKHPYIDKNIHLICELVNRYQNKPIVIQVSSFRVTGFMKKLVDASPRIYLENLIIIKGSPSKQCAVAYVLADKERAAELLNDAMELHDCKKTHVNT